MPLTFFHAFIDFLYIFCSHSFLFLLVGTLNNMTIWYWLIKNSKPLLLRFTAQGFLSCNCTG
jgi:hypothetical protein